MLRPAILRALTGIGTGLVRLNADHVRLPWNQILLAVKPGNPEGMNDVGRQEFDVHSPAHRNVNLIRSSEVSLDGAIHVLHVPPPLPSSYPNLRMHVSAIMDRESGHG